MLSSAMRWIPVGIGVSVVAAPIVCDWPDRWRRGDRNPTTAKDCSELDTAPTRKSSAKTSSSTAWPDGDEMTATV